MKTKATYVDKPLAILSLAVVFVSVAALAIGYMVMNVFSVSSNLSGDVCTTLFGSTSILTLKDTEVWISVGLSVVVIALFIIFYNKT